MFWIIVAVATWGIVHSWLASFGVKGYVRRTLGESIFRFYRLAYNLFSVISLIPILVLVRLLPDQGLYAIQPPWLYLMFAGQALALALLVAAVLQTDTASFIGLRQPFQGERPGALVTGVHRLWREEIGSRTCAY